MWIGGTDARMDGAGDRFVILVLESVIQLRILFEDLGRLGCMGGSGMGSVMDSGMLWMHF